MIKAGDAPCLVGAIVHGAGADGGLKAKLAPPVSPKLTFNYFCFRLNFYQYSAFVIILINIYILFCLIIMLLHS